MPTCIHTGTRTSDGIRTHTPKATDFESVAYTSSATEAFGYRRHRFHETHDVRALNRIRTGDLRRDRAAL